MSVYVRIYETRKSARNKKKQMSHSSSQVVRVKAHTLATSSKTWAFADAKKDEIERHWNRRLEQNPGFFNGTIFVLGDFTLSDACFSGTLLKTNFASFLYWKENGYSDKTVRDCFGSAIVRSSDGKVLLGRQSAGHINSGLTYFPGGFIDERDVGDDGKVAVAQSVQREAAEELGVSPQELGCLPGAYITFDGQLVSIGIELQSALPAGTLLEKVRAHIAQEDEPELEDVIAVAGLKACAGAEMPGFARLLLSELLEPN